MFLLGICTVICDLTGRSWFGNFTGLGGAVLSYCNSFSLKARLCHGFLLSSWKALLSLTEGHIHPTTDDCRPILALCSVLLRDQASAHTVSGLGATHL